MIMNRSKPVLKYVAFYPASSDGEEWWTADTLEELNWKLNSAINMDEKRVNFTMKNVGYGAYQKGNIMIYDVSKHPKVLDVLY